MTGTYLTFKIFSDRETASDMARLLEAHQIESIIETDALAFDPSYAFNALDKEYRLKIKQPDFDRAHQAIAAHYSAQLHRVEKDHYLFGFSNGELREVISKPDEWGPLDYLLAQKILGDRGQELKEEEAAALRNQRMADLAQPETVKPGALLTGYLLGILLPPVGAFMGWNWAFSKKTLPNGESVHIYDHSGRNHGAFIFMLGLILFLLVIGNRIYKMYQPSL